MQPIQTAWSVGDPILASRLNTTNADVLNLFQELFSDNLSLTYDIQGQLTTIVDNENSRTYNLDWTLFGTSPWSFTIQRVGDPKKYTITYDGAGYPSTIIYV